MTAQKVSYLFGGDVSGVGHQLELSFATPGPDTMERFLLACATAEKYGLTLIKTTYALGEERELASFHGGLSKWNDLSFALACIRRDPRMVSLLEKTYGPGLGGMTDVMYFSYLVHCLKVPADELRRAAHACLEELQQNDERP